MKASQTLRRPTKTIEKRTSDEFMYKVFWSGLLAKGKNGLKPTTDIILNATHMLVLEQYYDPDLWETHYLENFQQVLSPESTLRLNAPDMSMAL